MNDYGRDEAEVAKTRARAAAQRATQDAERDEARLQDITERVSALGYRKWAGDNPPTSADAPVFSVIPCGRLDEPCQTRSGLVEILVLSPAFTITDKNGEPFTVPEGAGLDGFAYYPNVGAAMVALTDPDHELRHRHFQIMVHLHPTLVPDDEIVTPVTLAEVQTWKFPPPVPGVDDAKATAALNNRTGRRGVSRATRPKRT